MTTSNESTGTTEASGASETTPRYTIAAAAQETGLTVHTLRFYERAGLLAADIHRTASGRRRYTSQDVEWINVCSRLRDTGMAVPLIRRYAELVRAGDGNEPERLEILEAHRERVLSNLDQLRSNLQLIDMKINTYREHLAANTASTLWAGPR